MATKKTPQKRPKMKVAAGRRAAEKSNAALDVKRESSFRSPSPQPRQALGRGLSSLLSSSAVSVRPVVQQPSPVAQVETPQPILAKTEVTPEPHISSTELTQMQPENGAVEQPANGIESAASSPRDPALDFSAIETKIQNLQRQAQLAETQTDLDESSETGEILYLDPTLIQPGRYQPRRRFAEDELNSLAASIRESGLLQPLIVRRLPSGGTFEIVAGERRWRAAKLAGLEQVPAIERDLTDREALGLAIVENVQRSDLNAIEEALSYRRLLDDFGETQDSVAKLIGKDRVTIANSLRLLKLDPSIQELIAAGKLSAGHGRALLMVEAIDAQKRLAQRAVVDGLSVRATEKLAQELGAGKAPQARTKEPATTVERAPAILALEDRLRRSLGTKVIVELSEKDQGEVRIFFYSKAELDNVLERLGA